MIEAMLGVMLAVGLYLLGIVTAKYILIDNKGNPIRFKPTDDILEDEEDEDNQFFK